MAKKMELEARGVKPMDLEEALRFLVRLANAEIDEFKRTPDDPEGLPAILYGLRRYFDVSGEGEIKRALEKARDRPDNLKQAIADLKSLLDAVVEGKLESTEFKLKAPRTVKLALLEGKLISLQSGDLRELIIAGAIDDLDDIPVKNLRLGHCKRTGCGKLFYKMKINQTYCDHRCANRAASGRRIAKIRERGTRGTKPSKQERAQS
jgi:hypothetical protein